nr:uncharacterized protein LOC105347673 [Crassostrea gigas]
MDNRKGADVWTIEGGAYTTEESSSTKNDYDIIYERADKEECFYPESSASSKTLSHTDKKSRCNSSEENEELKQKVISMYRDFLNTLQSDDFTEDLQSELQKSYPDYLTVLEKRITDIDKLDHGIVIAGETSSGKSTLINKILQKEMFKCRTHESTSTICKIRNSERVGIITESLKGQIEETDLTDRCDLATSKGVKVLRNYLKELTEKTSSKKTNNFRSVDIGFPIPFLMSNTILVDTPGIGGSKEVTQRLMEYLPNAVSFIFVIDVSKAGGMQIEKLPKILQSIVLLKMENEMPCFDLEDVIFVTNKWDTIPKNERDEDSSEDDETCTWKTLESDIKQTWPSVKEENIFRMNLKEVTPEKENSSTAQFVKFRKALELRISKAENIRIVRHLRFLQEILVAVSKSLNSRLELGNKTEKEQMDLARDHIKKIKFWTEQCREVRKASQKRIKKVIEDIAQECYDYMSTDEGKDKILNPPGRPPIMKVIWQPRQFAMEIHERVLLYIEHFLKSSEVNEKIVTEKEEIESFYKKVSSELSDMEEGWTVIRIIEIECLTDTNAEMSKASIAGAVLATTPIWLPIAAIGIALGVAFTGITIAISPLLVPTILIMGRDTRKKKVIDEEYNNCLMSIRSLVSNELESTCGAFINKLIDRITLDLLPKRIQSLEKMIQQLLDNRRQILANQEPLCNLSRKVKVIEKCATEFKRHLPDGML